MIRDDAPRSPSEPEASRPVGDAAPELAPVPGRETRASAYIPGWLWAAAAVAVAVFAGVLVFSTRRETPPARVPESATASETATASEPAPTRGPAPSNPPRHVVALTPLARLEPLPARPPRGNEEPGSFEEARLLAFEAYQARAYDSAAERLRQVLETEPRDDEVRLYLGSAELLRGNPSAALPLLETVTARSDDPAVRSEALWQLANAWLLLEDRGGALETIQRIRNSAGPHRREADSLEAEIRRASSAP